MDYNYIDRYKARLESKGESPQKSTLNRSKRSINKNFHTSPSYKKIQIDGDDVDSIVYEDGEIEFKPDVSYPLGTEVSMNGNIYLVTEFTDNLINPKGKIQLCNSYITIKSIPLSPPSIGYDDFMNPIYPDDYDPTPQEIPIPAIVEKTVVNEDTGAKIALDEDKIKATVSYLYVDLTIKSFWAYEEKFDVYSRDLTKVINEKGLLILYGERSKNGGTV